MNGLFAEFGTVAGEKFLTVSEVAAEWECSERTVINAIMDPHDPLPAFTIGRGRVRRSWRVFERELLAYMRRRAQRINTQKVFPTQNQMIHTIAKPGTPNGDARARRAARKAAKKG